MDAPTEFVDLEFHLTTGQVLTVTAQLGRDTLSSTDDAIRVLTYPDLGLHDELIVYRASLAALRTTQRTVSPPSTTDGTTRISGVTP